jgi:hypothetical protein
MRHWMPGLIDDDLNPIADLPLGFEDDLDGVPLDEGGPRDA